MMIMLTRGEMMNKTFIKRRYFDFRSGNMVLSPILQFGNFLMLAYLTINEYLPIYIFAPLFVLAILTTFTITGNTFRKIQVSTDVNMIYEKSTEAAKTVVLMMEAQKDILTSLNKETTVEFEKRLQYMKNIAEEKI